MCQTVAHYFTFSLCLVQASPTLWIVWPYSLFSFLFLFFFDTTNIIIKSIPFVHGNGSVGKCYSNPVFANLKINVTLTETFPDILLLGTPQSFVRCSPIQSLIPFLVTRKFHFKLSKRMLWILVNIYHSCIKTVIIRKISWWRYPRTFLNLLFNFSSLYLMNS